MDNALLKAHYNVMIHKLRNDQKVTFFRLNTFLKDETIFRKAVSHFLKCEIPLYLSICLIRLTPNPCFGTTSFKKYSPEIIYKLLDNSGQLAATEAIYFAQT